MRREEAIERVEACTHRVRLRHGRPARISWDRLLKLAFEFAFEHCPSGSGDRRAGCRQRVDMHLELPRFRGHFPLEKECEMPTPKAHVGGDKPQPLQSRHRTSDVGLS